MNENYQTRIKKLPSIVGTLTAVGVGAGHYAMTRNAGEAVLCATAVKVLASSLDHLVKEVLK